MLSPIVIWVHELEFTIYRAVGQAFVIILFSKGVNSIEKSPLLRRERGTRNLLCRGVRFFDQRTKLIAEYQD